MEKIVSNLMVTDDVCLVTIDNLPNDMRALAEVLKAVAKAGINVDMISQSNLAKSDFISLSFTISGNDLGNAMNVLGCFKQPYKKLTIEINSENTKLCVYGKDMPCCCGVAAGVFQVLADAAVDVRLVTTSEVDISFLIADSNVDAAVSALKKAYQL